jgi:hypothetical protein
MSSQEVQISLTPTEDQIKTLWVIGGYAIAILFLWNVPYLRTLLYPFKVF